MSEYVAPVQSAEHYNGASHENFTWSQSISDLDVLVNIPGSLTSPRDLKVHVSRQEIRVEGRKNILMPDADPEHWYTIFYGELSFPVKKHETIWSVTPGQHLNVYLEKESLRWWESLIVDEPKIQLNKIDCSRDIDDLAPTEQAKLEELMWKHQQKVSKDPSAPPN